MVRWMISAPQTYNTSWTPCLLQSYFCSASKYWDCQTTCCWWEEDKSERLNRLKKGARKGGAGFGLLLLLRRHCGTFTSSLIHSLFWTSRSEEGCHLRSIAGVAEFERGAVRKVTSRIGKVGNELQRMTLVTALACETKSGELPPR